MDTFRLYLTHPTTLHFLARPSRSKSGNDLAGSAAETNNASVTGLSSIDSPVSGSPPGSSAGRSAAANTAAPSAANGANGNGIASGPRGEESLSATLERLRLNAQAAKNGAQNGSAGAIGSRGDGWVHSSHLTCSHIVLPFSDIYLPRLPISAR